MSRYYVLLGKMPIGALSQEAWANWYCLARLLPDHSLEVDKAAMANGYLLSTLFTGVCKDSAPDATSDPQIFESAVFKGPLRAGMQPVFRQYYSTWEAAVAGHKALLKEWSKKPHCGLERLEHRMN